MLAKTGSVALVGVDAHLVDVEVDVNTGVPKFTIVGLPAKSVREAEQRTRSALQASSERWPPARVVANLAPASLRKDGTHFDLPIAVGLIAGDGRLDADPLRDWLVLGELGLNGSVRRVRGVMAAALAARAAGLRGLICPSANSAEAAFVAGIDVVPVSTLAECVAFFRGTWHPEPVLPSFDNQPPETRDMSDVRGQKDAKVALEVAAAGGHNLLLMKTLDGGSASGRDAMAEIVSSVSLTF